MIAFDALYLLFSFFFCTAFDRCHFRGFLLKCSFHRNLHTLALHFVPSLALTEKQVLVVSHGRCASNCGSLRMENLEESDLAL